MDLGSAVLAVIPPPTDQDRWDAFVAEFTLPDRGVNFARLEAWQGRSSGGGGGGGDEGCDGGNEDEDGDGDGDGDGDVT